MEHLSTRQYGTVLLARPVSYNVLTVLFALIVTIMVIFFWVFETTRKAQCQGQLLPRGGVIRIMSAQSGVVVARHVSEGERVEAGDVLFVLSGERESSTGGATQEMISRLLNERHDSFQAESKQSQTQVAQRMAATERRASDLQAEVSRIADQIVLQQRRTQLSIEAVGRYEELKETNYISAAQLQEKQGELLDQRQRLAELQRQRASSQRELANAQAELRDQQMQGQRDIAALERNASAIRQDLAESEARRRILVRAPEDGVVSAVTAEPGQTIAQGVTLATVLPIGAQLEAEIYAPSRSVGFVKPGMTVLLRYQAYPYQKFGQHKAIVREVASTSLRPDELNLAGTGQGATSAEPLYRIRLTLDQQSVKAYGNAMPLKSGMQVDASIMLETRRLYEWVLEPLFSISGRI